jgi:hypothetical protein
MTHELAQKITKEALASMLASIPDFKTKKPTRKIQDLYFKKACYNSGVSFNTYKSFGKRLRDAEEADEYNPERN